MSFGLTDILAIYGAVLSTAALSLHVIRDVKNRGRLRVHCYIGNVIGYPGTSPDVAHLIYSITNVGKEPVMVTGIGGQTEPDGTGKDHFFIKTRHLPKMLQPGEYIVEHSHSYEELAVKARHLEAYDSHGRTYRAPKRDVRQVRLTALRGEGPISTSRRADA